MSFAGNLEDLAIVDVIQLLHSTRKSGTLCVNGDKGRSQIVFSNGYIVSANHYNSSVRIGKILVDMDAISDEVLQQALTAQQNAGEDRKPLIGMLIEKNAIKKELAYKGLEFLIELTIVEMVSWQKGTFTLDVDTVEINDEYRYIPEKLQQEMNFDTQMVLMDALRIYDEKRAAGIDVNEAMAPDENFSPDQAQTPQETDTGTSAEANLSADILGLDSLDQIDMQIPETFTGLEAFDPSEIHRQKVREMLPDFPSSLREELVDFLSERSNIAENQANIDREMQHSVIVYGADELVQHGLMCTCKHAGVMVFTSTTPEELQERISQSLERGLLPAIVFDCPVATLAGFTKDEITAVRLQIAKNYPQLQIVQIASPIDYIYALQSLTHGATTVLPRSMAENRRDSFISDFMQFLESFPAFVHGLYNQRTAPAPKSPPPLNELRRMNTAAEISFFLLQQTSQFFDRSMTLIHKKNELVAERSFGIVADSGEGSSSPLHFRIPLDDQGVLTRVLNEGQLFFEAVDDATIREAIFGEISAPDKSKILLLPLNVGGRSVALIYADFGQSQIRKVDIEHLQDLAWLAGLTLEQALRRRKHQN